MFRWNLLLFGGAAAARGGLGARDIALPLVAAAEVTYLAGLSTLPRFQAAIDAKARSEEPGGFSGRASAREPENPQAARDRILEVLKSLTEDRRSRFLRLRARCVEMSRMRTRCAARRATRAARRTSCDARVGTACCGCSAPLAVGKAIARFLQAADESGHRRRSIGDLQGAPQESARTPVGEANQRRNRILRSLDDSITTAMARKENARQGEAEREFVADRARPAQRTRVAAVTMAGRHDDSRTRCRAASMRSRKHSRRPSRRSASCSRSPAWQRDCRPDTVDPRHGSLAPPRRPRR